MRKIPIYYKDIIADTDYMHDALGRYDLLGQILFTGYGISIPMKTRTPADLDTNVYPFMETIRRYSRVNTEVSLTLLRNGSLSGKQQIIEANKLLAKYQIELIPTA